MWIAIDTTNERREQQRAYNKAYGVTPTNISKGFYDLTKEIAELQEEGDLLLAENNGDYVTAANLPQEELSRMVKELERQMKHAAQSLEFEKAAELRDQIMEMRALMQPKA